MLSHSPVLLKLSQLSLALLFTPFSFLIIFIDFSIIIKNGLITKPESLDTQWAAKIILVSEQSFFLFQQIF